MAEVNLPTVSDTEVTSGNSQGTDESSSDNNKRESDSGYNSSDSSPFEDDDDDSDHFNIYDNSSDDEDVQEKILYIHEKQLLLARACRALSQEESYGAATALEMANMKPDSAASIWGEAKEVLRAMGKAGEFRMDPPPPSPSRQTRKRNANSSPKSPLIDTASLDMIGSSNYSTTTAATSSDSDDNSDVCVYASPVFGEGQWMARALIWSDPSSSHQTQAQPQDASWKLVSDPRTFALGLVPPTGMSMQNGLSLEEAIAVTDQARIVTQSTPPFCVVHVNRAFLLLANLRESVIGRPIEMVLQVTQSMNLPSTDDQLFLDSVITLSDKTKACRIQVLPVLDRSRRRRLAARRYTCMSHILIQVLDEEPRRILEVRTEAETSTQSSASNKIVGTVG